MRMSNYLMGFLLCVFVGAVYSAEIPGIDEYLAKKGYGSAHKIWRLSVLNSSDDEDDVFVLVDVTDKKRGFLISGRYSKLEGRYSEKEYELSKAAISNIETFEVAANYWVLPEGGPRAGLGGAQWILEGRNGNARHKTVRWSPFPPYYSVMFDRRSGKLAKAPLAPGRSEYKYSDEVGLDMLCLVIFLMQPSHDALIN